MFLKIHEEIYMISVEKISEALLHFNNLKGWSLWDDYMIKFSAVVTVSYQKQRNLEIW